jgi:orotidine 5'-phosphate decarboxylase subfamily 2
MTPATGTGFAARLDAALHDTDSLLSVGLDPRAARTPLAQLEDFCKRVIDATAAYAAVYKPNSAFYEVHGGKGIDVLARVIEYVPAGRIVILDAKRGDIGPTAEAYATAAFETLGADAVTVSPYLGSDAIAPFLARPDRGAFVLCHTSNPGARELQTVTVDGEPLYLRVAGLTAAWAVANVGLVVGATYPDAVARVRARVGAIPILLPGVGSQGGDVEAAVAAGLDANGRGLVVNSARESIYAADPGAAARDLRDRINAARAVRSAAPGMGR